MVFHRTRHHLIAAAVLALAGTAATAADFDIPAQPLDAALAQLARQAGLQLLAPPALVQGRPADAVRGSMAAQDAARKLLQGSGLAARIEGSTLVVERVPAQGAVLGEVRVVADAARPGDLPEAYAGGHVARGGQVGLLGNKDFMDTPFSQTTYTQELIQNQQGRTLGDVLANDPSVVKSFDGGSGIDNWNIRGLGTGNASTAFGGLYGISPTGGNQMAAESIERVEVLKGASALLNGISPSQGASLGFVNVVSKRAGDEPLTQFTPDYATDSRFGGHLDVGRRFGQDKEFGVRFNGVYRDGDTSIRHQSKETRLAALALDYRSRAVRLSADLGYQYVYTDAPRRSIYLAAGLPVPKAPDSASNWAQPWMLGEHENWYGTLRGEWDIRDALTAYVVMGRAVDYSSSQFQNPELQDAAGTLVGRTWANNGRSFNTAMEAGLRGHAVTGGVYHQMVLSVASATQSGGNQTNNVAPAVSNLFTPIRLPQPNFGVLPRHDDLPETSRNKNTGIAFADTLSMLDDRAQLMLGVRHQRVQRLVGNSYDEAALSPAAALVVKPWQSVSLYANYIQALSAGATAPVDAVNAGEVFAPYKTKQYEVGAKVDTGRVGASVAAFTTTNPSGFTDPATNVFGLNGENRYRGVELTAFGEAAKGVRFVGGVTYLDARLQKTLNGVNEGNRSTGIPKYRATLAGEWDTPFTPGLTLTGALQWQSSTFVDSANLQKADGWHSLDLGARYVIKRQRAEPVVLRATVRNVLNKDYWASTDGRLGLSEPRTFQLSATFRF